MQSVRRKRAALVGVLNRKPLEEEVDLPDSRLCPMDDVPDLLLRHPVEALEDRRSPAGEPLKREGERVLVVQIVDCRTLWREPI